MNPARRLFLQNAALSIAAASLAPAVFAQKLLSRQPEMFNPENLTALDGISMQTFEPWIGSTFRISLNNKSKGSLVLLSVNDMTAETKDTAGSSIPVGPIGPVRRSLSGPAMTSFALHFRGSGAALAQDTYMLSHDWLGTLPLLLVPSGLSGSRPTCTAVFSLLNQTGLN
jgi:hypothetical protein